MRTTPASPSVQLLETNARTIKINDAIKTINHSWNNSSFFDVCTVRDLYIILNKNKMTYYDHPTYNAIEKYHCRNFSNMAPDILIAITIATLELIDDRNLVYSGLTNKFYYNHSESLTPEEFLKSVEDDYHKEAKTFVTSPQRVLPKLTLCEKFLKLFQKKKAG